MERNGAFGLRLGSMLVGFISGALATILSVAAIARPAVVAIVDERNQVISERLEARMDKQYAQLLEEIRELRRELRESRR
jgi:F0F1-type ATP synthase membrane subunit b/b'